MGAVRGGGQAKGEGEHPDGNAERETPRSAGNGVSVIQKILNDVLSTVRGAQAVIFLDGEGEAVAMAGEHGVDMKLLGAWKEIHLDQIRDITGRLGLGSVQAVLFSLEEGTELLVPVKDDYCLLLFMSSFTGLQEAMAGLRGAVEELRNDIG